MVEDKRTDEVYCSSCGVVIKKEAEICPKCGVRNKSNKSSKKGSLNWTMMMLVSFFLGGFGVDRFLMGHIGLGVLKLITFGGFGIWWLIDFILVATKHDFEGIEWEY